MAIPLIVGGVLGATGAYKAIKGIIDNNKAGNIMESIKETVDSIEEQVKVSHDNCKVALTQLGESKVLIMNHNVKEFLNTFNKIKNVDFEHDGNIGNLNLNCTDSSFLQEMQSQISFIAESGLGVIGGAASGSLVAYGAYSGTMMFAAASTGTAISTLSGAAATNATLAWLGGGSIAAGGGGIAAGTVALGSLVAGPALLVAGWYMGSKAKTKLENAHRDKAKALEYAADMDKVISLTDGITLVTLKLIDVFSILKRESRRNLKHLNEIIKSNGVDYSNYNNDEKMIVMKNVKIMQLIKTAIDTSILNENGELLEDAESNILKISEQI